MVGLREFSGTVQFSKVAIEIPSVTSQDAIDLFNQQFLPSTIISRSMFDGNLPKALNQVIDQTSPDTERIWNEYMLLAGVQRVRGSVLSSQELAEGQPVVDGDTNLTWDLDIYPNGQKVTIQDGIAVGGLVRSLREKAKGADATDEQLRDFALLRAASSTPEQIYNPEDRDGDDLSNNQKRAYAKARLLTEALMVHGSEFWRKPHPDQTDEEHRNRDLEFARRSLEGRLVFTPHLLTQDLFAELYAKCYIERGFRLSIEQTKLSLEKYSADYNRTRKNLLKFMFATAVTGLMAVLIIVSNPECKPNLQSPQPQIETPSR